MLAQHEYFSCLVKENTRPKDDYVNATNWSKAFGKEWKRYRELARCKKTLDVLSKDYHLQISRLVEAHRGKVPETWIHPEIAIDFAEWLAPVFAVFVKSAFQKCEKGNLKLRAEVTSRDSASAPGNGLRPGGSAGSTLNPEDHERILRRISVDEIERSTAKIAAMLLKNS